MSHSLHPSMSHSMSRSLARVPLVSITFALVAGAAPLAAQGADVLRRSPRPVMADSMDAQLRTLRRSIDSLAQRYGDDDLAWAERRRVGEEIDRTVARFEALRERSARFGGPGEARSFVRVFTRDGAENASSLSRVITRDFSPRGWIGILVGGPATEFRMENGELFVRYLAYPTITSVDPGSPAQRAGIAANDTLLAYNGRDVLNADISTTKLLTPNSRLTVRVRREGEVRDFPLVVATAPSRIVQRRADELRQLESPWVVAGVPDAPAFPRLPPSAPVASPAPRMPRTAVAVRAPLPPQPHMTFTFSDGVVGAVMVPLSEGLRRLTGVQSGVFITQAPASSPAAESGLRDGDVIMKVDGSPVRSVPEVRALIARAGDNGERSVTVEYVREKRARTTTLRW
jgi:S1-C subfamily serine protease